MVSRRNREIGIRSALGASARDVLALVFKQGMFPVGIGLTIGLPAALAVTVVLRSQLVNDLLADPVSLFGSAVIFVVAAAIGCWIPTTRCPRRSCGCFEA